ncbi:MAG: type IV pilin protein [Sedimentibacter sp.]|jgi:type IV pilus assembly protein PilA
MLRGINMPRKKRGFTLIELIVVLAVLAIIMAIAIPQFSGVREEARVDADMATLASIAKLAEFEYVRQDLESTEGDALEDPSLSQLIADNFSGDELFQSKDLKGADIENIVVSFDEEGKVTEFTIGGNTYTYSDGRFAEN